MKKIIIISLILIFGISIFCSSCAIRAQLGAGLGAAMGASVGQMFGKDSESMLLGTGIGAAIGYAAGNELDK